MDLPQCNFTAQHGGRQKALGTRLIQAIYIGMWDQSWLRATSLPTPKLTLTQTLDLTQGRVGTWPETEQGRV